MTPVTCFLSALSGRFFMTLALQLLPASQIKLSKVQCFEVYHIVSCFAVAFFLKPETTLFVFVLNMPSSQQEELYAYCIFFLLVFLRLLVATLQASTAQRSRNEQTLRSNSVFE